MKMAKASQADLAPLQWPRADPVELAGFDPATKTCTMNCGPSTLDPRTSAERKLLCGDCLPRVDGAQLEAPR